MKCAKADCVAGPSNPEGYCLCNPPIAGYNESVMRDRYEQIIKNGGKVTITDRRVDPPKVTVIRTMEQLNEFLEVRR